MTNKQAATTASPTSTVNDSPLREQLKTIRGINTDMVLRNMKNDVNAYLRLLHNFNRNHGSDIHKLISHLANDEIEEAQLLVHNLKDAASMLYLMYLKQAASALEKNLGTPAIDKQSRILKESISIVQRELIDVLADIARIK